MLNTKKIKAIEAAQGNKLSEFLPEMVNDVGLEETARELGVVKSTVAYWMTQLGYRHLWVKVA